jgi:tRNA-binding EMAP/Myf-like protein
MSILKISEGADPNYLATVVKCPEITPHPNADKLQLVEIFGNTIIIGKDLYVEGEQLIYFPVECCISRKFLSWANLLDSPELNRDGVTKSYFGKQNRVKAIGLRGVPSQGFLYKVSELAKYYEIQENTFNNGDIFDTVGDDVLVTKYTKKDSKSGEPNVKKSRVPKWMDKTIGFFPRPVRRGAYKFVNAWYNRNSEGIASQIVDGEFHFHYKTENLGKNIWLVDPDDYITISSKCHGTSAIYANLQCRKSFNPFRSLANKLGFEIPDKEYRFVYASRTKIKN